MPKSAFDKIAGYSEEKEELKKMCMLIKKRDELHKAGGKLPKGLFLIGPNGVGKTVLAKAFIKESKCNVVSIDYNDVEEDDSFVAYIKDKFKEASERVPCILFIDELDKLIGNNQSFFMPDNMDKSRVILSEINRYSDKDGLFLLIVANNEYHLERSIIRSGRIDRIIEIDLPNQTERKEIIEYYSKGKKFQKDISYANLSKVMRGMSGADIESLLNNAVIKTFTEGKELITNDDIMSVYYDKVFSNSVKESQLNNDGNKRIAYHEAGHALITYLLNPNSLSEVTILSRGCVRGFVNRHENETSIRTLNDKANQISISLAGLITEMIFFNERTDGSGSDIMKAKSIVSELVRFDGYCGLDKVNFTTMIDDELPSSKSCSNDRLKTIEKAEDELISKIYKETEQRIIDHKKDIELIANELLSKKVLNKEEIVSLIQ